MVEWAKQHPYLAGAGVLGLFVLFIIWRNSSANAAAAAASTSSSPAGPSDSLLEAQMAYGAQLQDAQLTANTATANTQAQLSSAALQAGVQIAQINATQETTDQTTAAQLELGLANVAAPLALNGVTAQVSQTPTGIIFGRAQANGSDAAMANATVATVLAPGAVVAAPNPAAIGPQPGTLAYQGGPPLSQSGPTTCPAPMVFINGVCTYPSGGSPSGGGAPSCGPGTQYYGGACVPIPNPAVATSVAGEWSVAQANDAAWNTASQSQCIPAWWAALNGNPAGLAIC